MSKSRRILAVLLLSLVTASCHTFDSMFSTANTNWSCSDQGSSLPSTGRFCRTDNSTLTYFVESSLSSTGESRVDSRLTNVYAPTDLSVTKETSGTYSGSSETDIIFQQVSGLPASSVGRAWCDDAVSSTRCDQHYVGFKSATPPSSTICHETGHAVGLTHGANASPAQAQDSGFLGCMQTPSSGGGSTLTLDMIHQIDETY